MQGKNQRSSIIYSKFFPLVIQMSAFWVFLYVEKRYYTDIKFPSGDICIMVIKANAFSLRRYILKNLAVTCHY